jgi:hypothetical protein
MGFFARNTLDGRVRQHPLAQEGLMRRLWLTTLTAILLTSGLAACAMPGNSPPAPEQQRVYPTVPQDPGDKAPM